MSITQGMTGGGSWSGRRTLRAFPRGPGFTSLGRGNMQLFPGVSNTELLWALALAPLVIAGGAAASGSLWFARGVKVVSHPVFWAGVNIYEEGKDIAAWARGEDMSWQLTKKWRPIYGPHPMFGPVIFPLPFPYLDFTTSPSSGVEGPGEIPNFPRPPISMAESGEILSNPGIVGEVPSSPRRSTSKKSRYCPRGYYWDRSRRKCMPLEGPNDYRRFKRRYRKKG